MIDFLLVVRCIRASGFFGNVMQKFLKNYKHFTHTYVCI